jgi:hypothetical protein
MEEWLKEKRPTLEGSAYNAAASLTNYTCGLCSTG